MKMALLITKEKNIILLIIAICVLEIIYGLIVGRRYALSVGRIITILLVVQLVFWGRNMHAVGVNKQVIR